MEPGLGPPIIILFCFLKSSIGETSLKNSGLKIICIFLHSLFSLSVVPGGTVDFIITILFFILVSQTDISQ